MEDPAIPCSVEIRDDLRDGISLVSSSLADLSHGGVSLMELILEDLETLRFLIPFMAAEKPTPERDETILHLHSGLSFIGGHKRGYLRPAKRLAPGGSLLKTNSVSLVLSGPLCTSLSAQSDLFLLNYKNLLTEALKRQFFHYFKLASADLRFRKALNGATLPFLINEKYYFFQVLHYKEDTDCHVASEDQNTVSLSSISSLLVVPNLNLHQQEPSSAAKASGPRSGALEIEDCYLVKNVQDVKDVIKSNSPNSSSGRNATCSFYLDITHILNKYVPENNVSLKILRNIRSNIIEKVRGVLEEIERSNLLEDADQRISVQLFLYNYKTSFSNLSNSDSSPLRLLKDNFSSLSCLKKIILLEYPNLETTTPHKKHNRDASSFNKTTHNTLHLKYLISSITQQNGAGAKALHASLGQTEGGQCGDLESDEELQERYLRLKKELNDSVSRLLLDRNFDVFLELMRYWSLSGCDLDFASCTYSKSQCMGMLNWILRVCFGISERGKALRIAEVLHRNLVIGDSLYSCYVEASREVLSNSSEGVAVARLEGGGGALSVEDESIKSIIEQVNDQLFICKVFENEHSKINQILNQQFTPRILIYSSGGESSRTRLSLAKQEVMNYIQRHYLNYKLVHKHILSLVSPYVGQSEENIRQLFNTSLPTILFLEGIETISNNFISNSRDSCIHSLKKDPNSDSDSDSNLTDLDPNLFYDISFRIACHKERNKNIFNTNLYGYHHSTLPGTRRYLDDIDLANNSNESRTLLTTLLLCLDNVEKKNQNVIVIAFSNKDISELDQSITRAGRFDIHLPVD